MLTHIVCFKYKAEVSDETRHEHRSRLAGLRSLQGVVNLQVGADVAKRNRYVKIPPEFWTSGWLSVLSTPAVSMYLVLLCAQTSDEVSEVAHELAYGLAKRAYKL